MNIFLLLIIASTLAAMFLWSIHIDRRRSQRKLREEERLILSACRRWAEEDQNETQAGN